MTTLRVTLVDDQPAVLLSPELAERLQVKGEGVVHLEDGPNGVAFVHPDPEVEAQVRIMNEVMDRRRDVLRRLAE